MTPLQMLQATLAVLADPQLLRKGLQMERSSSKAKDASSPLSGFKQHFPVVLVDGSGWLNLASHVSEGSLAQVGQPVTGHDCLMASVLPPEEVQEDVTWLEEPFTDWGSFVPSG